jgi:hypothetical protein
LVVAEALDVVAVFICSVGLWEPAAFYVVYELCALKELFFHSMCGQGLDESTFEMYDGLDSNLPFDALLLQVGLPSNVHC